MINNMTNNINNINNIIDLIDKLEAVGNLTDGELSQVILCDDEGANKYLSERADVVRRKVYGNKVYIRGLIEFTNYCKNDCYYCGIRKSNERVDRYRLTPEEILECCSNGFRLGFRTFVLQGGEDPYWTDEKLVDLISKMRSAYPECAITLSIGERAKESYEKLYQAGANRYLLRHETADENHYSKLHPENLSLANRMECLKNLKEIGFQTGCGFMVGSPYQTTENLVKDLRFIKNFQPEMVGIGPFLPGAGTPFHEKKAGSADLTIKLLSMVRLLLPHVLLPATTALKTADADGSMRGIMAGANVVMPNLSPVAVREKYLLYDNKVATGDEAAESIKKLKEAMEKIGYQIVAERGDYLI